MGTELKELALRTIKTPYGEYKIFDINKVGEALGVDVSKLPYSIRVLAENIVRNIDGKHITEDEVKRILNWSPKLEKREEIPFMPARIVMQDFTGVPAVVDLAAMRSAMARLGGDPEKVNPIIQSDLIIDHSVQVDFFGTTYAIMKNLDFEYKRNKERYTLLKWAQNSFANFRVVPPGTGIIHQVNLEYLGKVVMSNNGQAYPDTLVGTDSHTVMINGLGVLGWGVGGIEAEAAVLGQPIYMLIPEVIGFKLTGELPDGATATDLILTIVRMLRDKGVVGKFVEFFGPGVKSLRLEDRATVANMAPECGSTVNLFPVDETTLKYLKKSGRSDELVALVEAYLKEQGMFDTSMAERIQYTDVLELDMSTVEPTVAGPKKPHEKVLLKDAKKAFRDSISYFIGREVKEPEKEAIDLEIDGVKTKFGHGSVCIAAITSCTNTSNPFVLIAAGLVAKKAVERGLTVPPYVKTSLAPGSKVVADYLEKAGLLSYLEALRFHVVGFGCTTCIGNSGPLRKEVADAITKNNFVTAAVLSGNRNYEGRVSPIVRAAFLASPPLVVAYALAGTFDIDLYNDPIAYDPNNEPVYLKDIWPTTQEVNEIIDSVISPDMYKEKYSSVFEGDERWKSLPITKSELYNWDPNSTYVQEPPFFKDLTPEVPEPDDILNARVLALLGDTITTDHISPAGPIPVDSPAGKYLLSKGVKPEEFNTYGSRRGNHEVMMRGTFANVRLRNQLVPGKEGGWTVYLPTGEVMTIYDAAMKYQEDGTPLLVIAGKEYGSGSSRDWAAKGTMLLGVKAVIAESFERIHRSNLVGMGVLPLQFMPGENKETLGLDGKEVYHIKGIKDGLTPRKNLEVTAVKPDGKEIKFNVIARVDTPIEVEYYKHGGILNYVLRQMLKGE